MLGPAQPEASCRVLDGQKQEIPDRSYTDKPTKGGHWHPYAFLTIPLRFLRRLHPQGQNPGLGAILGTRGRGQRGDELIRQTYDTGWELRALGRSLED